MPFEFGQTFNKFTKSTCGEGILYTLTSNPIYLSLLLTCILMIAIIALIGEDTEDILGVRDFIRLGVYILIISCVIISMHHYSYLKAIKVNESQNNLQQIYNTINEVSYNPNMTAYPVMGGSAALTTDVPNLSNLQSNVPVVSNNDEIEDVNLDL